MSIAGVIACRTDAFIDLTDIGDHRASTGTTIIGGITTGGPITTTDTITITAGIACDRLSTARLVSRGGFFIRAIRDTIRCRKLSHPGTPPDRTKYCNKFARQVVALREARRPVETR
jgi:hypothetical protein